MIPEAITLDNMADECRKCEHSRANHGTIREDWAMQDLVVLQADDTSEPHTITPGACFCGCRSFARSATDPKAWKQRKEESQRIERYLKLGGRPVIRDRAERGPDDGNGRPTRHKKGTAITFPPGYKNHEERRGSERKQRKMNRIIRRAKAAGRSPIAAIRRFLGEDGPARMPQQRGTQSRPAPPTRQKRGFLGRIMDRFRRQGPR